MDNKDEILANFFDYIGLFVYYRRFRPLDVPSYAFGSKNDDFCSKSVCPFIFPFTKVFAKLFEGKRVFSFFISMHTALSFG